MRLSTTGATSTASSPAPIIAAATREPLDRTTAEALFATWSGDPIVLVDSPPGAGKTRLITRLAAELSSRAGLRVAVAAQTRIQAQDVASRIAALGHHVSLLDGTDRTRPVGLHHDVAHLKGPSALRTIEGVLVATSQRWLWTRDNTYTADVLLVDEAYQLTYADLGALGGMAGQIALVGDPGQIAPVVTADTTRWAGAPAGPHLPAPQALLATFGPEALTRLTLNQTWRLGPRTTGIIQPAFYPGLPFTSARPATHLANADGSPLPEICGLDLTPTGDDDPAISHTAADRVRELLTCTVTDDQGTRPVTSEDIAVITPHVHQAALVAALLADLPSLLIGTANAAQGAERAATVVIHPLTGQHQPTAFNTDPGRTCVALSRHRAHATVLTDTHTPAVLSLAAATDERRGDWLRVHARILEAIHADTP